MRHDASPSDLNSREVNNPQNVAVQSAQELVIEYPKVDVDLCIGCGVCVEICPVNAIVMNDDKAFIIEDMCRNCQKCVRACPVGAIS
ncbi:MAG: 4Fe-4S dicluster domain-containing protein [Bacteroidia bacterium]|nr:4Fe-4S dicluster domain-containing protein [Bacteroidia bacterium]